MLTGVLLGFVAAFFQSASYLGSRVFSARYPGATMHLLAISHIIMAVLAGVLLPFFWPEHMISVLDYGPALFICVISYLAGQASLFMALKTSPASRVSPLLGIKVFMLAVIGYIFLSQHLGPLQWAAVIMSVIAAFLLSWTGDKLAGKSIFWILMASAAYCLSDLYIKALVNHFNYLPLAHGSVLSACLAYVVSGLLGVIALIFISRPTKHMILLSIPFAGSWFVGMLFLYACFGSIGVVFGNIIQSTRGIISILFIPLMVHLGMEHLEARIPRTMFYRRLASAVLMSTAIALYYFGQAR